jgi:hypothetical protein
VLLCHEPNKAVMVPDSNRAIERNGSSISADFIEHHWKRLERCFYQLFADNLAVVMEFFTLQDKDNICTLSVNILLICTGCETDQENSPEARVSTCF